VAEVTRLRADVLLGPCCTLEQYRKVKSLVSSCERQAALESGNIVVFLTNTIAAVDYTIVVIVFKNDVSRFGAGPVRIGVKLRLVVINYLEVDTTVTQTSYIFPGRRVTRGKRN